MLTPQEMTKLKQYFPADDNTHYVWKGDAIAITLPLNQEKRIIFPSKITPDLKGALTTNQLRMINDDKSLYLTAKKPFSNIRMYVTVENLHQVILVDLSTDDKANSSAAYIDYTTSKQNTNTQNLTTTMINNNNTNNNADDVNTSDTPISDNDNYVTLIRFAWQQLYAPERFMNNPFNITRAPMRTSFLVSNLIYGDKVLAHPIASWIYQNVYVTAVELRNKYSHETRINLNRDICGDWQAATLYPRNILKSSDNQANKKLVPAGFKRGTDSTVLFLISSKPFGDNIEVCNGRA
jgi:integrating conjugative element protein (TIGR03749 family)